MATPQERKREALPESLTYELYDLIVEKKLSVSTTETKFDLPIDDWAVMMVTAEGADIQVSTMPISDDSYKVLAGSTYVITQKKKRDKTLYAKGSASGTLWITVWR
jgi:hypothetical protein